MRKHAEQIVAPPMTQVPVNRNAMSRVPAVLAPASARQVELVGSNPYEEIERQSSCPQHISRQRFAITPQCLKPRVQQRAAPVHLIVSVNRVPYVLTRRPNKLSVLSQLAAPPLSGREVSLPAFSQQLGDAPLHRLTNLVFNADLHQGVEGLD